MKRFVNIPSVIIAVAIMSIFSATAQPAYEISLLANNSDTGCVVYHDQPVTFIVSIINLKAFEDQCWNRKAAQWLAEIKDKYTKHKMSKAAYLKEKQFIDSGRRVIKLDTLGSAGNPWYRDIYFIAVRDNGDTVAFLSKLMEYPVSEEIAILDTLNSYYVLYGIPPETLLRQAPGRYEIAASIDGHLSGKVAVNILADKVPPEKQKSEEMLAQFAYYYLAETDLQKALLYADSIIKLNAHSVVGFMLKGEVSLRKNEYREALNNFQAALTHFYEHQPVSNEPPEYIIGMIQGVKEKIRHGE